MTFARWLIVLFALSGIILLQQLPRMSQMYVAVLPRTIKITVNQLPLMLEVVSTPEGIRQGLSDRPGMPLNHGMLFEFSESRMYPFWMKHMNFPLDILWIQDGQVVDMVTLPPPKSGEWPATYTPRFPADRVLELNAGQAEVYGLGIGDHIDLSSP